MQSLRHRLPKGYADILDSTGLPWTIRNGRHLKVILAGKMVAVVSAGQKDVRGRQQANFEATIRRATRG
jgi:hypothetical protein